MADYSRLFTREHPLYTRRKGVWQRSKAAYGGGKNYIRQALVKHIAEIDLEYAERLERGYYINYPRRIARMITQYALSERPERNGADSTILEDWTRTGLRTDEVMRQFSTMINVYGSAWLAVDMPTFDGVKTRSDEIQEKLRPYCVALSPLEITDWHRGTDGEFQWIIARENTIDASDPYNDPVLIDTRKLWTRDDVTIVSRFSTGNEKAVTIQHGLGRVPFIYQEEVDGFGIGASHWFEDIVSVSDAILNNESEAQMNIVKQMFGLLVVSESFVNNATRANDDGDYTSMSQTIARSASIVESPEDKGISRYITPGGAENASIRQNNLELKKEMFEILGLAVSKDTRMVESAEAKMWDFVGVEQYLKTRADMMEQAELAAWRLMNLWMPTIPVPEIVYNRNFAVLELKDSVAALLELSSFNTESEAYQKEIGKTATALLNRLRQLSQDRQNEVDNEIENGANINMPQNTL